MTRRAIGTENRPWKSTATSRSGPIASRTAATRSATPVASRWVSIGLSTPAPFIFTAVMPVPTNLAASSATSLGLSPPIQP